MTRKKANKSILSYASYHVLVFCGSLTVLSITFNNIGLGKIVDAYASQMEANIKVQNNSVRCDPRLEDRLKAVESLAHQGKVK